MSDRDFETSRLSKDAYLMNLARIAAARATCPKRKVGAVLVKGGRVVSTGYNGAPPGLRHCLGKSKPGEGCLDSSGTCVNTIHAETNALMFASERGDSLYCTDKPCLNCLKTALSHNPDIRVVFWRRHDDPDLDRFLREHGLEGALEEITMSTHREMIQYLPAMPGERLP